MKRDGVSYSLHHIGILTDVVREAAAGSRIDSVCEIIERWAPPTENNTEATC